MNILKKIKTYYNWGGRFLNDPYNIKIASVNEIEYSKSPKRTEVINFILESFKRETIYLEIGVRNPNDNFNSIKSKNKYSVDPGVEFIENPVDFKVTSDMFFNSLRKGEILDTSIRFDVIFIDGLHLAEQVDRDIQNAFDFIKDDGFIILHDCNPPSEWHAREEYNYHLSPAMGFWNGTTWKAFLKWRLKMQELACCINLDWGIGIINKKKMFSSPTNLKNDFYEFKVLENNKLHMLGLVEFEEFKKFF
jgi:hypothetical protein